MDYQQLTAPCGLPCFTCYLYLANDDEDMRRLVSRELGLPVDEATCPGCRPAHGNPAHLPMPCRVFPCAAQKGVHVCGDCSDFPCDYLHPFFDNAKVWHNTKVFNLCLIRKMGLASWAQTKAKSVLEAYSYAKWRL